MNTPRIIGLLCGIAIVVLVAQAFSRFGRQDPSARPVRPAKGFAVVELFTSEGCSSCPPADQLIARIQREDKDQPVYILAFHVDYWDRQGWKDAFSDASYTRRQNQYAAWLDLQSIYTPQVVVNGTKEFVGSQEATLRNTINTDLQEASPATLTLSNIVSDPGKGKVDWQYQAQNAGSNSSLVVAIVQRSATTSVKAGENSGRTLSHVQIVRQLQTTEPHSGGAGSLILPAGIDTRDEEIIAFLQNNDNGRIIAATRSALP
jgi:hypothetical protein